MEPRFFFWRCGRGGGIHTSQSPPTTWRGRLRRHHPTLRHPTSLHLTPHRRGCPRRALFRVLGNPKVFALLFRKNASYDILRPPRGILAISPCRRDECWVWEGLGRPHSHPTLRHPTSLHLTPHRRGCPRRALFRVFAHPKVFALLFRKNAS